MEDSAEASSARGVKALASITNLPPKTRENGPPLQDQRHCESTCTVSGLGPLKPEHSDKNADRPLKQKAAYQGQVENPEKFRFFSKPDTEHSPCPEQATPDPRDWLIADGDDSPGLGERPLLQDDPVDEPIYEVPLE